MRVVKETYDALYSLGRMVDVDNVRYLALAKKDIESVLSIQFRRMAIKLANGGSLEFPEDYEG